MIYVIGSGPSGISVCKALLEQGLEVTMIDAGIDITNPPLVKSSKKYPKLVMGSNFPYRNINRSLRINPDNFFISYARGGLSNVWGAAILPFRKKDIKDWPKKCSALSKHYEKILAFLPCSGPVDDINKLFNFFPKEVGNNPKISNSLESLYKELSSKANLLKKEGIVLGYSKLAVNFNKLLKECDYCKKCMVGCPKNLIFNSSDELDKLRKNKNFHYQSGYIVDKVIEGSDRFVSIIAKEGHIIHEIKAERVYIAAGALASTRIICSSNSFYNQPINIKDSQYFVFTFLRWGENNQSIKLSDDFSLAKMFIEINVNEKDGYRTSHLQLYTLNEAIIDAIKKKFGILKILLSPFLKFFSRRLYIVQGYLHSDDSSSIEFILRKTKDNESIDLRYIINPNTKLIVNKIIKKINSCKNILGGVVIPWLIQIGKPGEGNHFGGSFPMSENPNIFKTDIYGRPNNLKKIHIVDSTVLPSIPSSTITLSVMANAYRIGSEYEKYQ
jgi:choline dehydrogenase-like flavoprotein